MVLSMAPELWNDVRIRIPIPRLTVFILLSIVTAAQAETLTVNSAADAGGSCPGARCTLRQAISNADQNTVAPARISFLPSTNNITTQK
jgi:CSLREA domain-containing protein